MALVYFGDKCMEQNMWGPDLGSAPILFELRVN